MGQMAELTHSENAVTVGTATTTMSTVFQKARIKTLSWNISM